MESKTLIAKITIPNYIRTVEVSQKQREKYYEWDGTTIKCGSKKLLQKYIASYNKEDIIRNNGNVEPKHLECNYIIIGFKGDRIYSGIKIEDNTEFIKNPNLPNSYLKKPTKFILCEEIEDGLKNYTMTYKKVVANETQAGKPKHHIIKGQDFYVGLNPFIRTKVVNALKHSYYEVLKNKDFKAIERLRQTIKYSYPIYIEMEIRDNIINQFGRQPKDSSNAGIRWDVGNRADPYLKTFLDFLTNGYTSEDGINYFEPLIQDDDRLHISSGNNAYFTPIANTSTPSLVFYIYKDTRTIWSYWFNRFKQTINDRIR